MCTTLLLIVLVELLLTSLAALLKQSSSLCLEACFTLVKTFVLSGWLWHSRPSLGSRLRRGYRLWRRSFKLSLKLFAFHAKNFSEALTRIWVLSLTECSTRVSVIKSGNFLDFRLANLFDDLFLLLKELIRVYFDLFRLCWFWLSWRYLRSRVEFGLCITTLQFGELLHFFLFTPLLFRVDISSDTLSLRLVLRRNNWNFFLCSRCCNRHLPSTRRLLRLASGKSFTVLGLFLLQNREALLLFLLTSLDGLSNHFLLLLRSMIGLFLSNS